MDKKAKTLAEQIDEYINVWCAAKQRPATLYSKKTLFNRILKFLNGRELTLDTANEFIGEHRKRGSTHNTIATETRNIRAFSNWQAKRGYADSFASEMPQPKPIPLDPDILQDNILQEIIDFGTEPRPFKPGKGGDHALHRFAKSEARAALHFMRLHGTRIGETLNIKGKDLKLNDDPPSVWLIRKGGHRVLLPLHLDFIEELKRRKDKDRVFETNRERCNTLLQRGAKAMGISEHLVNHSLRHSFATNKIREGNTLPQVSRILGHSDITITDKMYTHLNINDISKTMNSNAVYGIPIQDKLDDLQRYVKDRFKKDPRFRIADIDQSETEEEIEMIVRVVAKKPINRK